MRAEITITIIIGLLILGGITYLSIQDASPDPLQTGEEYPEYKEIQNPSGFLNTDGEEILLSDFIGEKVILLDFMTYSCINCQRTFPYLNEWYEKYKDEGLLVVGIHTPEFAF